MSTSCYEGSKLGDPLVFFLSSSSSSFLRLGFSTTHSSYISISLPDIPGEKREKRGERRCTGKRIFRHYLRSPSQSILEEINGRNWSGSGSESCIYTFRPFSLSIQKNVIPSEASRCKQREPNGSPARPIRSDPIRSPRVV